MRSAPAVIETIDTAPSYRQAFGKRRCLVPADGFFEWKKVPGGKIPYLIGMKDDSPFVFAGLWEGWKDPENGEWLLPAPSSLVNQMNLYGNTHPNAEEHHHS